jgi:hypothetical protein
MTYEEYQAYFETIVSSEIPAAPYNDSAYMQYAKLNWSRSLRWLKTNKILPEIEAQLNEIQAPQNWVLITEPWCGDAAHIVPIIYQLSTCNALITLRIELRDSEPHRIDQYLTNGGKSIPILIIKDENQNDVAVWGPRPIPCQNLFQELKSKETPFDDIKEAIQKWYNNDKSITIQKEIIALLTQ